MRTIHLTKHSTQGNDNRHLLEVSAMDSGKGDISFKAKGAPSASPLGAEGDAFPGKLYIEETYWPCSLDWDSETVSDFWAQDLRRRQGLFSNMTGLMSRKEDVDADRVQDRHLDLKNNI